MKNRLDQIEHEAVEADEQWDRGRSAFNANHHAPPIDIALANGERTLTALRAVLDYVNKCDNEGWTVWPEDVRAAVAAALGEES